jgi:hypothetical protein
LGPLAPFFLPPQGLADRRLLAPFFRFLGDTVGGERRESLGAWPWDDLAEFGQEGPRVPGDQAGDEAVAVALLAGDLPIDGVPPGRTQERVLDATAADGREAV